MSIVVIGATGHLGTLVVHKLLAEGVSADSILGTGRNAEKLAKLAQLEVRTARVELSDPASIRSALSAGDSVLLISGNEVGQRVPQHGNVIDAAVDAGAARIVYTSAPKADTSALVLAPEHKATEELIIASGLPYTFLRNGWYNENYADTINQARATGTVVASVGDGKVASANRSDFAEAAAKVLVGQGHDGKVYELSGDTAWDYNHLATTIGEILGREVTFQSVTPEQHTEILTEAGLDAGTAGFVVALDQNIKDGLIGETNGQLSALIGHPTTPLAEGLRAIV